MQRRETVAEVLVHQGEAGRIVRCFPLPMIRHQQAAVVEYGLIPVHPGEVRHCAALQAVLAAVCLEQCAQMFGQRVGVQLRHSLLRPVDGLVLIHHEAVPLRHLPGDPGQQVLTGHGTAQNPALVGLPQQLPLKEVPDQRPAAVGPLRREGVSGAGFARKFPGFEVQCQEQGIAQVLPNGRILRRNRAVISPQIGPDRLPRQRLQCDGDRLSRQFRPQIQSVHGAGDRHKLRTGMICEPLVHRPQHLPALVRPHLVEAVQQHQQVGTVSHGAGSQAADLWAVSFLVESLQIIRNADQCPVLPEQLVHGDVDGGGIQLPRVAEAEQRRGLADAALPLDHHIADGALSPGPPHDVPDGADRAVLPNAAPCGNLVKFLLNAGKELAVDLVGLQQLKAGMRVPRPLQQRGEVGAEGVGRRAGVCVWNGGGSAWGRGRFIHRAGDSAAHGIGLLLRPRRSHARQKRGFPLLLT